MQITQHTDPQHWYHVIDVFSSDEVDIIKKYIPTSGLEISGRRAHNTATRSFVNVNSADELKSIFEKYDSEDMRNFFTELTGVNCATGRLRVEIINDQAGAYLEKHVDIKEKLITFQIYMNQGNVDWGTTIYTNWDTEYKTVPFVQNTGWLTHCNADVIHGVKQNSVTGERHSVIINYIEGNWRDTDQLFHLT